MHLPRQTARDNMHSGLNHRIRSKVFVFVEIVVFGQSFHGLVAGVGQAVDQRTAGVHRTGEADLARIGCHGFQLGG